MEKFKLFILLALSSILLSFSLGKEGKDCSIIKNSNFTYINQGKEVFVVFKGNEYVEYHNNRKHFIKAEIEWITDCEYNLIIEESTIPGFPLDGGTSMNIQVNRVSGNKVFYTCTLGTKSWKGKMTKTKKSK